MDKSIGNQKTVKPAGSDDRSMGSVQTMPSGGAGSNGDHSLGSVKTMSPGGLRSAGRRFCAGDVILGRYRVTEELGQGGMGVVYRCFDTVAGIDVALKALPPEVAHNSGEMEEVRANFRLVSKLHHPNIANVNTLERDTVSGDYYLIMECVDGYDVRQWVRRRREDGRPLTLDEVTIIAYRIAEALDYAHEQGVIHRDIKPSNVRVNFEGEVKVLDFGLAAQLHMSLSRVSQATHGTSGTGPYMAPEQWRGQRQGTTADQYALAATVYELLGGSPPFENHDMAVLREAVLKDAPLPLKDVPPHVNAALLRGLEKVPEQRFESCAEFVKALAGSRRQEVSSIGALADKGVMRQKKAWWLVAGVAMVAILAGLYYLLCLSYQSPASQQVVASAAAQATKPDAGRKMPDTHTTASVARQVEMPAVIPTPLAETRVMADGLLPLFNSRDLTGWVSEDGDGNCWSLQGDELILNRPENQNSWLLTDADYSDFILILEFKLGQGGNSGVTLRAEPHEAKHGKDKHLEIQILDDLSWPDLQLNKKAGSLFGITNDRPAVLSTIGNWNEMEIEMRGLSLRVSINGLETVNTRLDGLSEFNADNRLQREKGRIGLQAHGYAAVSFRNIRIKELKTAESTTPTTVALASTPSQQSTQPWTNSLGMVFVPVPGAAVRFSIWAARVQDYQAFVTATGRSWEKPNVEKGPTHPAVNIRWNDAKAFCAWLTEKERREGILNITEEYRLPMDLEWSAAVGLENEPGSTPQERDEKIQGVYPWGTQSRRPNDAGNFFGGSDGFVGGTSPVGHFKANGFGLYDMGGNVYQWCEDFFDGRSGHRVMRGSSWGYFKKGAWLSSKRWNFNPNKSSNRTGFRCVLAGGGVSTPQILSAPVSTDANPSATAVWVIPTLPKANSDGWITLFDGKYLYGCDPNNEVFTSGKVYLEKGVLWMNDSCVWFNWKAHNAALRIRVKKISGQHVASWLGPYFGWFNGGKSFGISQWKDNHGTDFASGKSKSRFQDFFDMEFTVVGGKLTLMADGATVVTTQVTPLDRDELFWIRAFKGLGGVKRVEAKVLGE